MAKLVGVNWRVLGGNGGWGGPGGVSGAEIVGGRREEAAGDVRLPQVRPRTGVAREHDQAAVGGPGGPLVQVAGGEDPLARAVGAHHADVEDVAGLLGEG